MYDTLEVYKKSEGNVCTLYVSGVLDYSTMDPFIKKIQEIEVSSKLVIVNFERLEFIDSTGIGAIINLVHEAKNKNFKVKLDGMNNEIEELFETLGVFQVMKSLLEVGG
ncbi:STAS domain-containing protein [Gracilibacillus lacisalsi]|uniref:STAS domain-containing protein n=1 Tax=Gracilibacillus lacisalsi TaxID=393087 RepID=UPI000377DF2E|nr:STAS domain-containing protein [Gracilibacillus lacisalsi]